MRTMRSIDLRVTSCSESAGSGLHHRDRGDALHALMATGQYRPTSVSTADAILRSGYRLSPM
jgi:hypothetical protein